MRKDDVVRGGASRDSLGDEAGQDVIHGGRGRDVIFVAHDSRNDVFDAGASRDEILFAIFGGPVTVDLTTGQLSVNGDDLVKSIEAVLGTDSADTLLGDGRANTLLGFGGADDIEGRGGDDFLNGGDGRFLRRWQRDRYAQEGRDSPQLRGVNKKLYEAQVR